QHNAAEFGLKPRSKSQLDERAKEKFFDQSNFNHEPGETERETEQQLVSSKFALSNRRSAAAEKNLKGQQRTANHENHWQMAPIKRTQSFSLNSEITKPIAKREAEDPERDQHKHDQLLCQRDREFDLWRTHPILRKVIVDPLRTADEIDRQCDQTR